MATETIGVDGMTYELKQTYDRRLLQRAYKDFVYMNYGVKRPFPQGGVSLLNSEGLIELLSPQVPTH